MISTSSLLPEDVLPGFKGSSLDSYDSPLDQQRAASMADEGGVSGAETDACEQREAALGACAPARRSRKVSTWGFLGGLAAAVVAFELVTRLLGRSKRAA